MLQVLVSGLVTGWAIAVPIGAVGAFLVTLTARTSWRVGAAGALGIATVDGLYATVAVVAGAAVAAALEPMATPLAVVSGIVLLVIALLMAAHAVADRPDREASGGPTRPAGAFALFLGITSVNPTTVVYFAAVVLGNPHLVSTAVQGVVFVLAAFVASASWQLVLAGGGAALGRVATSRRAHRLTGLVSALVITGLAVHTMLG